MNIHDGGAQYSVPPPVCVEVLGNKEGPVTCLPIQKYIRYCLSDYLYLVKRRYNYDDITSHCMSVCVILSVGEV